MKKLLLALILGTAFVGHAAFAQVPYDPPTAVKAAPNVFLLMDASRTTMINGSGCRGLCHVEGNPCGGFGGEWSCSIYRDGETRLQLARRVLTGGWGWNTNIVHPTNGPADASTRQDGIMDQYRVRWGVIYSDGLGARFVLNPTPNGAQAQKAVIDFGQPGHGEDLGPSPVNTSGVFPDANALNSWVPYYRTTQCCGNYQGGYSAPNGLPWRDQSDRSFTGARQARTLYLLKQYLSNNVNIPQWSPPSNATPGWGFDLGPGVEAPNNATAIYGDPANVLVNPPPAGCRRNFAIYLLDGHGYGATPAVGAANYRAGLDPPVPTMPQTVAAQINLMGRISTPLVPLPTAPTNLRNQLFAIHFGVQDYAQASLIADTGYDGVANSVPGAFPGAPGGVISDMSALYAAFASIFQLILSGNYLGSPPTITRQGDVRVTSTFEIQDCASALPSQCNIGRIGHLKREIDANNDGVYEVSLDLGAVLRSRVWTNRKVLTSYTANDFNCGANSGGVNAASCGVANKTATLAQIDGVSFPGNAGPSGLANDYRFMMGDPSAQFANGVARGDTRNSALQYALVPGPLVWTNPYKLSDIANSRPVVVGAPTGIGEDVTRWSQFRGMVANRSATYSGGGNNVPIGTRDEIIYIGGNDGMLHAFLSRTHAGTPAPGRTTNYGTTLGNCTHEPFQLPNVPASYQSPSQPNCLGVELWGYTPRLLHPFWSAIRGGHYFMVDGTPVVSDVLFTKGIISPPAPNCLIDGSVTCGSNWEYRTVLMQCLGGGGPGCFALDVSNPYAPRLLWERSLTNPSTTRVSSTSRAQIARMRKVVGGVGLPYYVALMGGGLGESSGGARVGSFIGVGLEDGLPFFSPFVANGDFAGPPSCLDTNNDSYIDTCYISTTNASVYKIQFANADPAAMTMTLFFDARTLLASRGLAGSTTIRNYGRVVATFDRNRDLHLFFGTGNFEDVQNVTEANYFFELMDPSPEGSGAAVVGSTCNNGAGAGVFKLGAREKIIFDPVIASGSVLFTSYAPDPNPCLPGDGALYGLSYDACAPSLDDDNNAGNADVVKVPFTGQGLPSSPVVNEKTGGVTVGMDNGTIINNAARVRLANQLTVSKLWWRVVR